MKQIYDITVDRQLQELAKASCPKEVDVVDAVMDRITKMPAPKAKKQTRWQGWTIGSVSAAAACAALLFFVISSKNTVMAQEVSIGNMLSDVYGFTTGNGYDSLRSSALMDDSFTDVFFDLEEEDF